MPERPLRRIAYLLAHRGIDCRYNNGPYLSVAASGPDGFEILVLESSAGFILCFGGLEEHVASDRDVVDWVTRANNSNFRLRTDFAGSKPCRWSLERLEPQGAWVPVLETGHAGWFQSKRRVRTEYRCNAAGRTVAGAVCLALSLLSIGIAPPAYANSPGSTAAVIEHVPGAVSPRETVDFGIALARQGNVAAALAKFDEAIRDDPKLPVAYLNRGVAHANAGTLDAAIADFTSVIGLEPDSFRAFHSRGFTHWRRRDYPAAKADFERAIELAPKYPNAYAGRALVHAANGMHAAVIADCNTAIELGLDDAKVRATRGFAFMALGRNASAIADFRVAAAADPDNAATYSALVAGLAR